MLEHRDRARRQLSDAEELMEQAAVEEPEATFSDMGAFPPVSADFGQAPRSPSDQAYGTVLAVGTGTETSAATAAPTYAKAKRATPLADQVTTPATPQVFDPLSQAKTLGGQSVSTVNTSASEARILNELRHEDRRFNAAALAAAQVKLGVVNASGAFNTETLRKLVEKKGAMTAELIVADATWTDFYTGSDLFLAAATKERGDTYDANNPDRTHRTKADRSARGMGYRNWTDYKAQLQDFSFLGVTGSGSVHPHLQARLTAAETFLVHRYGSEETAKEKIGWKGGLVGSYGNSEADIAKGTAHFHTMGLAVDFDAGINPYLYPDSDIRSQRKSQVDSDNTKIQNGEMTGDLIDAADAGEAAAEWWTITLDVAFTQAASLFHGVALTKAKMVEWSKSLSTEELHAKVASASAALKKYYDLAKTNDDAKILKAFTDAGFSADQAREALPEMKAFPGRFDRGFKRDKAKGVMTTHSLDLVVALRDVAGLSWGGTEMSHGDNGDFMHFDCRHDPLGIASRDFVG